MKFSQSAFSLLLLSSLLCDSALAVFIDGTGSYSLRGETRTKPGFSSDSGVYQAVDQFFRLDTELRSTDSASFFLGFRLFDNDRESHLGDSTQLNDCPVDIPSGGPFDGTNQGRNTDCSNKQQNTLEPRYNRFTPKVQTAYALYAMDFCLLKVGRRDRHWGMGMILNDGSGSFDTDASIYDGVTCDINLQKSQTLGFSLGYDKISETGGSVLANTAVDSNTYGATDKADDLDQIFFTIEFNDHKVNAGRGFSQQIGIYFANIFGGKNTETDIKIADLYLNFLLSDLVIQNEVLFRLGESTDPNLALLGGVRARDEDTKDRMNVQSLAVAGSIEYFFSRSGNFVGPSQYQQGTTTSHSSFLEYAYAPGDADGYYPEYTDGISPSLRDSSVKAVGLHRNFKPAMLLFNGKSGTDSLRLDGIFDPYRVMNATLLSFGYRYKSLKNGNFEIKAVTASLNETIPAEAKALYTNSESRPIGYHGVDLGTEVNMSYSKSLGKGLEAGLAGAFAAAGDAWKTKDSEEPSDNFLLQGHLSFSF